MEAITFNFIAIISAAVASLLLGGAYVAVYGGIGKINLWKIIN